MRAFVFASWLLLFVSGAFSLLIESGLVCAPVAPDLARLPARLGAFELGPELAFDPSSLGEQPPERYTFRSVQDGQGHEGRLFIGYYRRAQRWSGRPHDLDKCYAAQGWEEREAHRLDEAHRPWSRLFEREGTAVRVVHWLERPGADDDALDGRELAARLGSLRGFRPDVASIYFEFAADATPAEAALAGAVHALSATLETLW